MKEKDTGLKPFFKLILSTNIPKAALLIGLIARVLTTLAGLVVPLLTKNLGDGFSTASLSKGLIALIVVAFLVQAVIDGISTYLLASVLTTLCGLVVALLTNNLVDGLSTASLSKGLIALIVVAFIVQAVINGTSTYLLTAVGQKIVARLREQMWLKLIFLPVSYYD